MIHASAGERLVYGGHTIGLALAQATRVLPNLVTVLGWESCDHTGPVHEGDTLYSELHVEAATPLPGGRGGVLPLRSLVYAAVRPTARCWTGDSPPCCSSDPIDVAAGRLGTMAAWTRSRIGVHRPGYLTGIPRAADSPAPRAGHARRRRSHSRGSGSTPTPPRCSPAGPHSWASPRRPGLGGRGHPPDVRARRLVCADVVPARRRRRRTGPGRVRRRRGVADDPWPAVEQLRARPGAAAESPSAPACSACLSACSARRPPPHPSSDGGSGGRHRASAVGPAGGRHVLDVGGPAVWPAPGPRGRDGGQGRERARGPTAPGPGRGLLRLDERRKALVSQPISTHPDGLRRLLAAADVVIESSAPRRARTTRPRAGRRRPARDGRIWLRITGHGTDGDRADWVAFGDDAAVSGGLVGWHRRGAACSAGTPSPIR